MTEALLKSHHPILRAMFNVIGSQASPGGHSPSSSPDGRTTDPCGRPVCLVSHSPLPESRQAPTTSGTSGQSFNALSASADLQSLLANKLAARLQGKNGSPEYVWTCKQWVIPSQPSIYALRARARTAKDGLIVEILNPSSSEHPTSGSGSTGSHIVGYPTPATRDHHAQGAGMNTGACAVSLATMMEKIAQPITGWPTPRANESQESLETSNARMERYAAEGRTTGGAKNLNAVAQTTQTITGWRSPATSEPGVSLDRLVDSEGNPWTPGQRAYDKITGRLAQVGLTHEAQAAIGSAYPSPQTASEGTMMNPETNAQSADSPTPRTVNAQAPPRTDTSMTNATECSALVGWPTPATRDHKGGYEGGRIRDGKISTDTLDVAAQLIQTSTSSPAATAKLGVLNPNLPRWLQGYPVEWCQAAIRAHRAMPTKRRKQG
jgi:hypothetical protein